METEEVRAEIERRKKQAIDLELRETLWTLHYLHLSCYAKRLKDDPEMVYPEIRETLEFSYNHVRFHVGEIAYMVLYNERPDKCESTRGEQRKIAHDDTSMIPITIGLEVNEKLVFEFKMTRIISYSPDWRPSFSEILGDVTSFIDGPWVTDVIDLLRKIEAHKDNVLDKRKAPRLQQELQEDIKRFGL